VSEEPRSEGLRHAIGELLVCLYCLGQWVGTGLPATYIREPRLARMVAAAFTVVADRTFSRKPGSPLTSGLDQRAPSFANPAAKSFSAWSIVSAECSSTTPSHARPRRTAATRHGPDAPVYPVLTPSVPG